MWCKSSRILQLIEAASFNQLLRTSKPVSKQRASTVRTQPPNIRKENGNLYVIWNFKAFPSYENRRHKGYIKVFMPLFRRQRFKPLADWDCEVSCDCKDYLFRQEVANKRSGASKVIFSNGKFPFKTNPRGVPGLCKHLIAAGDYISGLKLDPQSFLTDFPVSSLPSKTGMPAVAAAVQKQGAAAQVVKQKKFLNQPKTQTSPSEPTKKEAPKAVNKSLATLDKEEKEKEKEPKWKVTKRVGDSRLALNVVDLLLG